MLTELTTYLGVDTRTLVEGAIVILIILGSIVNARRAFWRGRFIGTREERNRATRGKFAEKLAERKIFNINK